MRTATTGSVLLCVCSALAGASSPSAGQVGAYTFEDGTARNQAVGPGALPDLKASGVVFAGGAAAMGSPFDFLELPLALGSGAFTIAVDASYDPQPTLPSFAISQFGPTNSAVDVDFLVQQFPGTTSRATFFNGTGSGPAVENGKIDGARHRIAITWDGAAVGNYFDGVLLTAPVAGAVPDIDGSVVRFGDRSLGDGLGATGRVHEIRVFDRALSQAELSAAFFGGPETLSIASGGRQSFSLDAGPANAGLVYLVLGTLSGTSPGISVGSALLPLTVDAYLLFLLSNPGSPPLSGSPGTLDGAGTANAAFTLPAGAPAALAGVQLHHAYVLILATPTLIAVPFASNAVPLTLVP